MPIMVFGIPRLDGTGAAAIEIKTKFLL